MSKEFEEIVLKKLEKLDAIEDTMQNVVLKKLDVLDTEVCGLKTEVKSINQRLDNQEKEFKSMQETVKNLNDNFTVFDFEINKKIDTLFDAITANNDKHEVFEKSIVSLNTKTFNHDIRISVLEDYNKNEKIFAMN